MRKRLGRLAAGTPLALLVGAAPIAADPADAGFTTAEFFIEFNAADRDVGVQVSLGGDAWRKLEIQRPGGREILDVEAEGSLEKQGVSEFFFESAEPTLDEVSLEEFLARFPEGSYGFAGETLDGRKIRGTAHLSHAIPRGAQIVAPAQSGATPPLVDPKAAVIAWQPVRAALDGTPIEIAGYQVAVEQDEPLRKLVIDLPASATRVHIPPEFLAPSPSAYGFEVLAVAANGNQTISAGEFRVGP